MLIKLLVFWPGGLCLVHFLLVVVVVVVVFFLCVCVCVEGLGPPIL